MKTKGESSKCDIQSHDFSCSQDLRITFHCIRCKKQLLHIRQPLSFILITLSNAFLYFFAYNLPQSNHQDCNIKISDIKVPCFMEPFRGINVISADCFHCGVRLGTVFQADGQELPQCIKGRMLLQTDSLLQDPQNEGIIEFLIESAKENLNILRMQVQRSTAKLYDLLLSAKKELLQVSKFEDKKDLSIVGGAEEEIECPSSRDSQEETDQPQIYQSMENQRLAIEAELKLSSLQGMDLKAIFKDLIAHQRSKKTQREGDDISFEQSEESSQESQELYFAQLEHPKNNQPTNYQEGFYYCDQKWYEYKDGEMHQSHRIRLHPIQVIDPESEEMNKELQVQIDQIRLHVKSKLMGESYLSNEKQAMLSSKARKSQKKILYEHIEEHNRLIEDEYQSMSSDSEAQVEILDDLTEFQREWEIIKEEQACRDTVRANALESLQFYEETDKWIRDRLKVTIAQEEKQKHKVKLSNYQY